MSPGIIVRNEGARNDLLEQMGDIGIVLCVARVWVCYMCIHVRPFNRTLYESKGLEFDDVSTSFFCCIESSNIAQVLLYDFFETSPIDVARWRVVLNALSPKDASRIGGLPVFNEVRHAGVCTEVCRSEL